MERLRNIHPSTLVGQLKLIHLKARVQRDIDTLRRFKLVNDLLKRKN